MDLIIGLGSGWLYLVGYVRCEYLSFSGINRLLNAISLEEIDFRLWTSLCRRLRCRGETESFPATRFGGVPFRFDSSRPFDGVLIVLMPTTDRSWIQFDFQAGRVSLTDYTIKSDGSGNSHLRRWSIEVSPDGEKWIQIDHRDTDDLNGNEIVKSYPCRAAGARGYFRCVRLIQPSRSPHVGLPLLLRNLEFFGFLSELPISPD